MPLVMLLEQVDVLVCSIDKDTLHYVAEDSGFSRLLVLDLLASWCWIFLPPDAA